MHAVNQADVAPRATLAQVLRAAVAEARWALVVFGWRQPLRSTSVPDWLPDAPTGHRGVVLVHGFCATVGCGCPGCRCCGRADMPTWR
jgi:hypothetical protein